MTTVAANGGGMDFGAVLDKILGTYQAVSTARVNRDVAKYNMAGATQLASLHNPQASNMLEAYGIANPVNNGTGSVATSANNGGSVNTKTLMIGGAMVLGGLLIWKAIK